MVFRKEITLLQPYVIEGLDCSGKKTIAAVVKQKITESGINCEIVIGPLYGGILRRIDDWLVNLSYKKSFRTLYWLRKKIYVVEPILDGLFFRSPRNTVIIKISSHYRSWARAIVENDRKMVKGFENGKKHHYKYMGASLISTDFQNRIDRHRLDKRTGKTNKTEKERFFNNNADLFERWDNELKELLITNVQSVIFVYNNDDIDVVAELVYKHIMGCINEA